MSDVSTSDVMTVSQYSPHEPIIIVNEDNFTDYGFSGSGTIEQPYLIENLEISSPGPSISITGDFDAYYKIINCRLSGAGSPYSAVHLGTGTGSIEGCEIANSYTGIQIENSSKSVIDCTFINTQCAIFGLYATDTEISNNNITFIECGISLFDCNESILNHNDFSTDADTSNLFDINGCINTTIRHTSLDTQFSTSVEIISTTGIIFESNEFIFSGSFLIQDSSIVSIDSSYFGNLLLHHQMVDEVTITNSDMIDCGINNQNTEEFTIQNNVLQNTSIFSSSSSNYIMNNGIQYGYVDLSGDHNILQDNSFTEILSFGIRVHGNYTDIHNNSISGIEGRAGIVMDNSILSNVSYNIINGFETGIEVTCSNVFIFNNTIANNDVGIELTEYSSHNWVYYNQILTNGINAIDNGDNNMWDDNVSLGNHWDDAVSGEAYHINGSAGSVDRWPYVIESEEGVPFMLLASAVVLAIIVIGMILIKRK
jgi:hypothetical protein